MARKLRNREYTPRALQNMVALGVTEADFEIIDKQVDRLAEGTIAGFLLPLQSFDWPNGFFRYDVGRYKLNYTFDNHVLSVLSVLS